MSPFRRPFAVLLLALYSAGCHSWHSDNLTPLEIISRDHPSLIRLTTRRGAQVVLHRPVVTNDSVVGVTRSGPIRLGADEIERLEVRQLNAARTIGLVVGVSAGVAAVGALTVFTYFCHADHGHMVGLSCVGTN